jgi:hypothetical protein
MTYVEGWQQYPADHYNGHISKIHAPFYVINTRFDVPRELCRKNTQGLEQLIPGPAAFWENSPLHRKKDFELLWFVPQLLEYGLKP